MLLMLTLWHGHLHHNVKVVVSVITIHDFLHKVALMLERKKTETNDAETKVLFNSCNYETCCNIFLFPSLSLGN